MTICNSLKMAEISNKGRKHSRKLRAISPFPQCFQKTCTTDMQKQNNHAQQFFTLEITCEGNPETDFSLCVQAISFLSISQMMASFNDTWKEAFSKHCRKRIKCW